MLNYLYTIVKEDGNRKRKIIHLDEVCEDIEHRIYKEILEKKSGTKNVSEDEIIRKYKIYDIEVTESCFGCVNGCCGQKDHMECPSGCLHDMKTCATCMC